MKQFSLALLLLLFSMSAFSQEEKKKTKTHKYYTSSGAELIFALANYSDSSGSLSTPLRFSAFFHMNKRLHRDFGKHLGSFTGIAVRNTGFTLNQSDTTHIKRRVYTIGVPAALKFGNMAAGRFFFAGVEGELAVNYKEKSYEDNKKINKFNEWFSNRTPLFLPSAFAGYQTKNGFNVALRYYLTDFMNTAYKRGAFKPYSGIKESRIFYLSVSYNLKRKKKETTAPKPAPPPLPQASL